MVMFKIKRGGAEVTNHRTVEVQQARNVNIQIANETLEIIKNRQYTSPSGKIVEIGTDYDKAFNGTIYYPDPIPTKLYEYYIPNVNPTIEVVNEKAAHVAQRLIISGKKNVVALNFASGICPGGAFLDGSPAQEEELCRGSALYPCIKNKPLFYNQNIMQGDEYYTDGVIYSPDVPFFRDEDLNLIEIPFNLSIITCPAPRKRGMEGVDEEKLDTVLRTRIHKILKVARNHGHRNIILGAWGCGAFGNNPIQVAEIFQDELKAIPNFDHIVFAVYDKREGSPVFETFREICLK
jgi:uncharacterized protein (TIGR02452 family)